MTLDRGDIGFNARNFPLLDRRGAGGAGDMREGGGNEGMVAEEAWAWADVCIQCCTYPAMEASHFSGCPKFKFRDPCRGQSSRLKLEPR